MAFPASPVDQQLTTVNGTVYQYSTATSSWTRKLGTVSNLSVTGNFTATGSLSAGNIYSNGALLTPSVIQEFSATSGQSLFTVTSGYTVGTVQVFANGIALGSTDFTANSSPTVSLTSARRIGDVIRIMYGFPNQGVVSLQAISVAMSVALG